MCERPWMSIFDCLSLCCPSHTYWLIIEKNRRSVKILRPKRIPRSEYMQFLSLHNWNRYNFYLLQQEYNTLSHQSLPLTVFSDLSLFVNCVYQKGSIVMYNTWRRSFAWPTLSEQQIVFKTNSVPFYYCQWTYLLPQTVHSFTPTGTSKNSISNACVLSGTLTLQLLFVCVHYCGLC